MTDIKPTPPWYVLTGGPSAGKTTLVNELAARGYHTIIEPARSVIEEALREGKTLEEIRNPPEQYFKKVHDREFETLVQANHDHITFFDRSFLDSIGYMRLFNLPRSERHHDAAGIHRFENVFLLDLLPYEQDEARNESAEDAVKIHDALEAAYSDYGYEVVKVPILPVPERTDFVIANL